MPLVSSEILPFKQNHINNKDNYNNHASWARYTSLIIDIIWEPCKLRLQFVKIISFE